ncbi:MAG: hypothetical protein PWP46_1367 [Fusobacteriaceae bacterium]|nr:hypothetical protein [Fusobacteriales bacterium]MDN5304481.1 hypothetical protein [Fusobacteriaceae bacterium]
MEKYKSLDEYIESLSNERKIIINKLREIIKKNIPNGFVEELNYNMIGYVVPLSTYPKGYRNGLPLPFINLASQKNYISFYHLGLYSDENLLNWFKEEYSKKCNHKLDMGKSCIRFKKFDDIPYELIGELVTKIDVPTWISIYESSKK